MVSIAFRVSDAEAKQIRDAALNEGSTVSQYVRKKVFSDSNSSLIAVQKEQKEKLEKILKSSEIVEINQRLSNELIRTIIYHISPEKAEEIIKDTVDRVYDEEGD